MESVEEALNAIVETTFNRTEIPSVDIPAARVTVTDEATMLLRRMLEVMVRIDAKMTDMNGILRGNAFSTPMPPKTMMMTKDASMATDVVKTKAIMERRLREEETMISRDTAEVTSFDGSSIFEDLEKAGPLTAIRTSAKDFGYNNRNEIWGVAMTSLMMTFMRQFLFHTKRTDIVVDEAKMAQSYTRSMAAVYMTITARLLPDLQDPVTKYLLETMSRLNKTVIPEATADNWAAALAHPSGAQAVAILSTLINACKAAPEILLYPVSRIIAHIEMPIVVKTDGTNRMNLKGPITLVLGEQGAEKSFTRLKTTLVSKYAQIRMRGKGPIQVMATLQAEAGSNCIFENASTKNSVMT
jgi:hypothetical protein